MNIDADGVIIIHGGSKQDGKDTALDRFKENFKKLSASAQNRLVVENCEMVYSIQDLLPISKELNIPIIVDFHHHNLNPGDEDLSCLLMEVLNIWKNKQITPLFHVSESKEGVKKSDNLTIRRAHSDYVNSLPKELLCILNNTKVNLDVEAKMKEQAVFRLREIYDIN
jgi:UV damage endonuclease UvdE